MKNFLNKKIPFALITPIIGILPTISLPLTSCSSAHVIQFANFESYMDNGLMDYLTDNYNAQFQWYTVTEMIETKFKQTYDVAAPSGYELKNLAKKGWLSTIDWTKFNINGVTNGDDALESETLFAKPIRDAINKMNEQFKKLDPDSNFNVLDYGVPYFAQSFMFTYKGNEVTFYTDETNITTNKPNWADIFYTISPRMISENPSLNGRKGLLDDPKTMYDISRIMETICNNPSDINKWTNKISSNTDHDTLQATFSYLKSKAQKKYYTLNTDSGVVSRNLADHGLHSFKCAFTWSGDALYAAQGAGEFQPYTSDTMHIQRPYGVSLDEIEFLVINNKNDGTEKINRIYSLINDICFADAWNAQPDQLNQIIKDKYSIGDGRYKIWAMQNFDTINYTPTLKSIYDFATDKKSLYWNWVQDEKSKELYTSILKFERNDIDCQSRFGLPLSPLQNSDIQWAWIEARDNL